MIQVIGRIRRALRLTEHVNSQSWEPRVEILGKRPVSVRAARLPLRPWAGDGVMSRWLASVALHLNRFFRTFGAGWSGKT
jgi:hypothetical protein